MINVAIQAAKYAPYIRQAAVKSAPYAKDILVGMVTGVVVNETFRAVRVHRNKPVVPEEPEKFETPRPLWKKLTNTHADETYGQGVKRRSRLIWDICCYGFGCELQALNLITVKLVKGAFYVIGKVLTLTAFTLVSVAVSLVFACTDMKINTFAVILQRSIVAIDQVTMVPFGVLRSLGRKIDKVGARLMAARNYLNVPRRPRTDTVVVVEEFLKPEPEPVVKEEKPVEADIHHLVVLLTQNDLQEALKDPKKYGADLFARVLGMGGFAATNEYRERLVHDMQKLGLSSHDVALVMWGYDEARTASETNATS